MEINNNRRRFVAAFSYGTILYTLSPSAFAKLPKCEKGEIVRNGWRAYWSSKEVKVVGNKSPNINRHAKDAVFYDRLKRGEGRRRGDKSYTSGLLGIEITTPVWSKQPILWIKKTPVFFETSSARYDARWKIDYDNTGIYRTPITDGSSGMADVRVTLRRKGVRGLYTNVSESGATFSLSQEELKRFLGEGPHPLIVEFSADNRLLISRSHDVNGILQALSEATPQHNKQKLRADKKYCAPGCFLTTATCDGIGLTDDCWELQMLRSFRDKYMMKSEIGKRQVAEYYKLAPSIVERIRCHNNTHLIYLIMYWRFILPSAILIKLGNNEKARNRYSKLIEWVQKNIN